MVPAGGPAVTPAATPTSTAPPGPPPLTPAEKAKRAEEARATFDTLYADTLRKVKSPREGLDLASSLLTAAKAAGAKGNPEMLALIAQAAADLAVKLPEGYPVAIEAFQLIVDKRPTSDSAALEGLANVCQLVYARSRVADRDKAAARLIDALVTLGDDRTEAGDYARAAGAYRRAQDAATTVKSPDLASIQTKYQYANSRQATLVKIDRLARQLEANPDDAAAHDEIVRLNLVELDSPERAAKYLDPKAGDVRSKFVLLAGMTPGNLPEAAGLQLGDWYAGLADQGSPPARLAMLVRARTYYSIYLDKHAAIDASKGAGGGPLRRRGPHRQALAEAARAGGGGAALYVRPIERVGPGRRPLRLRDFSPQGNAGTIHGGQIVKGLVGDAMTFDGVHDYIDCGTKPVFQITGDLTIAFWIQRVPAAARQTLVNKSFAGEGAITVEPAGVLTFSYGRTAGTGSTVATFSTAAPLDAGVWTHIALVRDFTNKRMLWYKNGKKSDEAAPAFSAVTASLSPLYIGTGFAGPFAGRLDELAVYGRALTEKEVQLLFEMGQKGTSLSGK